ncbi:MAG: hypothetical protein IT304_07815 [Dehalococcoidia bacterium]|nr:hypothetical protein [Dehalococcoidia bacterium]
MTGFFGQLATRAGRGLQRLGVKALRTAIVAIAGAVALVVLDALRLKDVPRGDESGPAGRRPQA